MNWTLLEVAGGLLHVGLACWVTLHALLNKRDVAAAIAWIGLAWLSPMVGSLLYGVFGINRVERRARRVRRRRAALQRAQPAALAAPEADQFAPLQQAIGNLTQRPLHAGNALRLLRNGDDAYPPMLAAIAAARHSVALASYIFEDDAAGRDFIAALIAAKERGVAVRVLVDGIGSGYFLSPAYVRLRSGGVRVERFMHSYVPWRMPFLNLRNHRKILVVDGTLAFTGGINIAAENVLARNPRSPVRDVHFEIEGPVVAEIAEAFAADWYFAAGEELGGALWFPRLAPAGGAGARVVTSGPDHEVGRIGLAIIAAIGVAQRSIRVQTPYFLPDERFMAALSLAALRGVAVDIVVPERADHRLLDWAMPAHVEPIVAAGARVWLVPPPFDHAKLMVVDEEWSLIGSANWDMRSLRLNFEMNVAVSCADFGVKIAAEIAGVIGQRRAGQVTLAALRARPLPIRLRDSAARLLLPYL